MKRNFNSCSVTERSCCQAKSFRLEWKELSWGPQFSRALLISRMGKPWYTTSCRIFQSTCTRSLLLILGKGTEAVCVGASRYLIQWGEGEGAGLIDKKIFGTLRLGGGGRKGFKHTASAQHDQSPFPLFPEAGRCALASLMRVRLGPCTPKDAPRTSQ